MRSLRNLSFYDRISKGNKGFSKYGDSLIIIVHKWRNLIKVFKSMNSRFNCSVIEGCTNIGIFINNFKIASISLKIYNI